MSPKRHTNSLTKSINNQTRQRNLSRQKVAAASAWMGLTETAGKTIKTTFHIREMIKKERRRHVPASCKKKTIPTKREWKTPTRVTVILWLFLFFVSCTFICLILTFIVPVCGSDFLVLHQGRDVCLFCGNYCAIGAVLRIVHYFLFYRDWKWNWVAIENWNEESEFLLFCGN